MSQQQPINAPLVQLRPHQRVACDFILQHPYCGAFLEVGFGKSLTTLEALYELAPSSHVLIIGPKAVMRATWTAEIEKFNFPFRTKSLIQNDKGKPISRTERLERYKQIFNDPPTIYFINKELIEDLIDHMPKQGKATIWPFPYVIIDEAQSFKSYSSKRFKALSRMRPAISRLIELSGTPTPNGLMDLWPLVYLLDQGARLGTTITAYRQRYFFPTIYVDNHPVKWELQIGAEQAIYNAVDDIVISMRNVASVMPSVTINDIELEMTNDEFATYKTMAKEYVLDFADGTQAIAANAAVLQAKLLQMSSGALYVDDTNTEFQEIHNHKLDETVNIINNTGTPVLVAYHFKSDKKRLMKRLTDEGLDPEVFDGSPDMVKRWNDGAIRVMLLQPASAGHGLNLQYGPGHTIIWFTMTWNLEHYIQTNARIYRQGQQSPVIIHRLIVKKTIDRTVASALASKKNDLDEFIEAVKLHAIELDIDIPYEDGIANAESA